MHMFICVGENTYTYAHVQMHAETMLIPINLFVSSSTVIVPVVMVSRSISRFGPRPASSRAVGPLPQEAHEQKYSAEIRAIEVGVSRP